MAAELAPHLEAEIISVDSMQVYRGMDIGTAKPDDSLRRRVPNHLLDIVNPTDDFSVAEYQEAARRAVEDIAGRGNLPFLVGGTGLYFEAVVFDMRFPPGSLDDPLRRRLEEWGTEDPEGLRKRLEEVDPEFAAGEGFANTRRVIRAIEVYERTGTPFSAFQAGRGERRPFYGYVGVVLDAPRPLLYRAIDARVDRMIEAGLVDEVSGLAERGGLSRTARQALGYKEILDYLDRGKTLEETICDIKKRSRRYAKRQITWFRRIPWLRWFELEEGDLTGGTSRAAAAVLDYLGEELERRRIRP
jgi:tRNA dimethylallyltransferase